MLTFVPPLASDPKSDPVAWGATGVLQIGLSTTPSHDAVGPVWMALHLRHGAVAPVGIAANVRGVSGAGRLTVKVLTSGGKTAEWPVQDGGLAFSLHIPKDDDVRIPFKFEEPHRAGSWRQTNTLTVSLCIRDTAVTTEQGTFGPMDLETGGVVLNRCWAPDVSANPAPRDVDDEPLGISPRDIVIPVPSRTQ
jgi:hypothetical protein